MFPDQGLPVLFQLGEWSTCLCVGRSEDEHYVRRFVAALPMFTADTCIPPTSYWVVASPPVPDGDVAPDWLPESVRQSWIMFHRAWARAYQRFSSGRSLLPREQALALKSHTFSWSNTNSINPQSFIVSEKPSLLFFGLALEKSTEDSVIALFVYSLFLASQWHVLNGGLCLHSSVVTRDQQGFVFLGASQSGKSTIAKLSLSAGYTVLGDDVNFVIRRGKNNYSLAAGPSVQLVPGAYSRARPTLRGIFVLKRDAVNYLVPLSTRQTAGRLFESFMQAPSTTKLPDSQIGMALATAADIARSVPGYELHFHKSPDFWRLIDDQFPG